MRLGSRFPSFKLCVVALVAGILAGSLLAQISSAEQSSAAQSSTAQSSTAQSSATTQSPTATQGATATQDAAANHPLETKTELVKLDVSVLDPSGNFVGGLAQDKFRVSDNGTERPIVFFTPVEAPALVVVMLETSPAVYVLQDEHIAAAYALVTGLAEDDRVALISYSDAPKELVSLTTDKNALLMALTNNQYTVGMANLNLYDSTSAVVDALSRLPGKKAIVLLTTGLDTSGPEHLAALEQRLRAQDVVIFAVGLGGSLNAPNPDPKAKGGKKSKARDASAGAAEPTELDKARSTLQRLATITGGGAYFPGTGQDFSVAYQEIASALRHEYVLGIAPGHDGQVHKLSVSVAEPADPGAKPHKSRDRVQYRVSAREGYVAPQS